MATVKRDEASVGALLRQWRRTRGLSQLELALRAGVSLKHVGFVETGRSSPSRPMMLRLAAAMDVPAREVNLLLAAAGHSAAYRETRLDEPGMEAVRSALELMLRRHMPYPAWILDSTWTPLLRNDAQKKMLELIRAELGGSLPHDLLFDPNGLRRCVRNWEDLASMSLRRLRREAALGDRRIVALLERCSAYPGLPPWEHESPAAATDPVLPVHFVLGGRDLRFMTTLATLGTAVDVTGQDLRIELYHPLDEGTEAFCREELGCGR